MEFNHYSVLLKETINGLHICSDGLYIDGTLGGAGHSYEVAKQLTTGHLYGFDQDKDAIKAATERLTPYLDKVTIVHSNYENMTSKITELGIHRVNGILLDLGVSSFQLDESERGFTYRDENAPLDMRMNQDMSVTAADILNSYSQEDLQRILFTYGEEKYAKQIVKNIIAFRENQKFETAGQLNEVIRKSIPVKVLKTGGHPSKRTYQALRIELNRELSVLEKSISGMIDLLAPGGRLCIITFHSLEDRIVKNAFKEAENPCTCPKDFPVCVCGRKPKGINITRKPILPSDKELAENSRSKSAKLRIFERT